METNFFFLLYLNFYFRFTNDQDEILTMLNIPMLDCPELYMSGDDVGVYEAVVLQVRILKFLSFLYVHFFIK